MTWLGWVSLGIFVVHGSFHALRGHPEDALWACTVGNALVGAGLLGQWPVCAGIGALWLCTGPVIWLIDLSRGGEFYVTSLLTHVVGPVVAVIGVRQLGMPEQVWWKALVAFLALMAFSRCFTPPAANVNVAFAVWMGWERYFQSHALYVVLLAGLHGFAFFFVERALRQVAAP